MLAETVNKSDEIWLNSMHDDQAANTIGLKGSALSVHAIADLMRNIQNTGYFKSVDIKTAEQDDKVKDLQVFNFEIVCAKQPAQPPASPAVQAKKAQ
jgi:Tfp pilus assembly protein PilN